MQEIAPEITDIIKEEGGDVLRLCYQCGTCTGTCPWNQVSTFLSRRLIHKAQLGLVDFEDEEVWKCVGCKLCVERCPRGVEVPDLMRALRRVIVGMGAGKIPDSLRITAKNISGVGNPLGEPPEKRTDWAKDLDTKTFAKGTEILYFPCCYQSYDPRNRKVAQAMVNILKKANIDFGILSSDQQSCCGESVRKAGNEGTFQSLAQSNIEVFDNAGVSKILVSSPHCLYTLTEEYPGIEGKFEIVHFTQYLAGLIKEGKIKFSKELKKKVTYHDSCLLGRYSGIYDEPREILKSIPGVELVEMKDNREYSLCCGAGAGGLWQETKKGERFSEMRLDQAIQTGAEILAVACPYCMVMFEDTVLTLENSDAIVIKDITELVDEAI